MLNLEFDDEKQWSSNAVNNHLVAGIKSMYDALKEKYEAKCLQFDTFFKKQHITKAFQNEQYIKVLELEIKHLKNKFEYANKLNLTFTIASQTQKNANNYVLVDLQNENNALREKNKQLQKRSKQMGNTLNEFQMKIRLDKKLILEKDNNLHMFERKNKDLNKEIQKIKQINITLEKQLIEIKQKYTRQVEQYKRCMTSIQQKGKRQIDIITKSKQTKIQFLEQDNAYLHKMIQQLRSTNLELNKTNQQLREYNMKFTSKGLKDFAQNLDLKSQGSKNIKEDTKSITLNLKIPHQNRRRIPQKADKKHHEDALKTRKIQLLQVLDIAQLIRLKLIAQQLPIDQVKQFFDFKKDENLENQDNKWKSQYITMRQVEDLLTKSPFNLEQCDSILLSRYLIEDVQEDYVYCDLQNQNHRQVVKSIFKTLIQQYPVYSSGSPQYYEMNDAIEKYGKSLKSALKSYSKDGVISKSRLLQAMRTIGMQVQPSVFDLILAKMAIQSKKLNQLVYTSII